MSAGGLVQSRVLRRAAGGELSGSLWRQAGRRFRRNRAAMGSIGVLLAIALASVLIPAFWPHAVEDASWENILLPPSFGNWHWFGTDANGRDQFVRVFYGGRISLTIGLMTTLVALGIGVGYGRRCRVRGRAHRRFHDAHRGHPVFAAAVVLHHHPGDRVRGATSS